MLINVFDTGSTHSTKLGAGKPYKHVKLMPLSHVKRVIDIHETEGKVINILLDQYLNIITNKLFYYFY